jgi:TM2 domain-containing membrane protein YozV
MEKIDMFLMAYAKYFDGYQLSTLRERLMQIDDFKLIQLQGKMKDPTTMLIVSIVGGHFGIDRFMIGDVGLGVAKLLTCGGFGIWTIVDMFLIMGRTRERNLQELHQIL